MKTGFAIKIIAIDGTYEYATDSSSDRNPNKAMLFETEQEAEKEIQAGIEEIKDVRIPNAIKPSFEIVKIYRAQ